MISRARRSAAFSARAGYDGAQLNAGPWLYGIATNLLRESGRREGRRWRAYARASESGVLEDRYEQVHSRVDASALAPVLIAALSGLAAADRDALLLLALTDLSYEEIAVATGARSAPCVRVCIAPAVICSGRSQRPRFPRCHRSEEPTMNQESDLDLMREILKSAPTRRSERGTSPTPACSTGSTPRITS